MRTDVAARRACGTEFEVLAETQIIHGGINIPWNIDTKGLYVDMLASNVGVAWMDDFKIEIQLYGGLRSTAKAVLSNDGKAVLSVRLGSDRTSGITLARLEAAKDALVELIKTHVGSYDPLALTAMATKARINVVHSSKRMRVEDKNLLPTQTALQSKSNNPTSETRRFVAQWLEAQTIVEIAQDGTVSTTTVVPDTLRSRHAEALMLGDRVAAKAQEMVSRRGSKDTAFC